MNINNKFSIGEIVYLITEQEQHAYMVVEIYISSYALSYKIVNGPNEYVAYEMELSTNRDIIKTLI